MTVLFRLAWTWLQNWHEPAMVGAAVALFGLAYLLPLATSPSHATQSSVSSANAQPTAFALGLYDIPQDEQFYREKWIAEANAFYSANPPRNSEPLATPTLVITASARTRVDPTVSEPSAEPVVVQATHIDPLPIEQALQTSQFRPQTVMALPAHAQRWRVVTCLAAGLLASLLFVSVWPANQANEQRSPTNDRQLELVGRGDGIPVRIPSAWIALRPTWRQTARRSVMSGSYLIAALGVWGIVS